MNCDTCIKRKVCAFTHCSGQIQKSVMDSVDAMPTIFRLTVECLEYIPKPTALPRSGESELLSEARANAKKLINAAYGHYIDTDESAAIAQANATMDHLINQAARR